jgi:hypothetical protein
MRIICDKSLNQKTHRLLQGGGHMQSHPSLSKLIQDKPFFFRELYLGIFISILVVILLSCGATPPNYFFEESLCIASILLGEFNTQKNILINKIAL